MVSHWFSIRLGIARLHALGEVFERASRVRAVLEFDGAVTMDGGVVVGRRHVAVGIPTGCDVAPGPLEDGERWGRASLSCAHGRSRERCGRPGSEGRHRSRLDGIDEQRQIGGEWSIHAVADKQRPGMLLDERERVLGGSRLPAWDEQTWIAGSSLNTRIVARALLKTNCGLASYDLAAEYGDHWLHFFDLDRIDGEDVLG